MFPTINIKTVHLHDCRRVVLFHLNKDGVVEMRHYAIRANPVGVSRPVKRIIQVGDALMMMMMMMMMMIG